MSEQPQAVKAWHAVVESGDPALLDGLLADDVVFRSPAVFAPQEGKDVTALYLRGAMAVLGPSLRYVGEWYGPSSAVLEFEAELDGLYVHGVDMLRWNDDDRLRRSDTPASIVGLLPSCHHMAGNPTEAVP